VDLESAKASEEVRVGALSSESQGSRAEDVLSEESFSVVVDLEEGGSSVGGVGQRSDGDLIVAGSSASSVEEVSSGCDIEFLSLFDIGVSGSRVQLVHEPSFLSDAGLEVSGDGLNFSVAQELQISGLDLLLEEFEQLNLSASLVGSDDQSDASKVGDVLEEFASISSSFFGDGLEVLSLLDIELSDLLGSLDSAEAGICVGLVRSANEKWWLVSSAGQDRDHFRLRINQILFMCFLGSSQGSKRKKSEYYDM
jgi:hypothetical protein